jgi:hypothetical protein
VRVGDAVGADECRASFQPGSRGDPLEALRRLEDWQNAEGMVAGLGYGPEGAPLTDEERKGVAEARAAIEGGDYLEEDALRQRLEALRRRGASATA